MKLILSLLLILLFNLYANGYIGIASVSNKENKVSVIQLSSSDWDSKQAGACVITENSKFPVSKVSDGKEEGCENYDLKIWNSLKNKSVESGYALIRELSDNCSNSFMHVKPKTFEIHAADIRYVDIEKERYRFESEVFKDLLRPLPMLKEKSAQEQLSKHIEV